MKNSILYFGIISFLFQSCYTYKAIDMRQTQVIVGKNYKIRQDRRFIKTELKAANDSTFTFVINKHEVNIPASQIKEIKMQKYSTLKTVGLGLSLGLATVIITGAIVMSNFDLDLTIPTK